MPASRWVEHRGFSGLVKNGTVRVAAPAGARAAYHLERAFYLVAQLEAPRWGSVQGYDGAGLSGGPLHSIAYLRASQRQGSLFGLLRAVQESLEGEANEHLAALLDAFDAQGWRLAPGGTLVRVDNGEPVPGPVVRNALAPPNGKVPRTGPHRAEAERWCTLLHDLLSDPASFDAQKRFTLEYLLRTQRQLESTVYAGILGREVDLSELRVDADAGWTVEADLSLCVYHAHSVNAPAIAKQCLSQAMEQTSPAAPEFAATLIHVLGKKRYGRWADTGDGRNRYDRTRVAARRSGLWPASLFADGGIMPADLPARAPRPAPPLTRSGTLERGARGEEVRAIQEALTALGYRPGEADGAFGGLTVRALELFQREHGLPVSGKATPATRRWLRTAPPRAAVVERVVPARVAANRVDAFLRAPLRTGVYALQRDALGSYYARCQDEPVSFPERLARTAEWFFEQGVHEEGGESRGPWVDFIRVIGGGVHRPASYPPWCAYFVSACLRITDWVGDYGVAFTTNASATRLYLKAPAAARITGSAIDALASPRGSIFVRTRSSQPVAERAKVLRGLARKGHAGIVVDREDDGTLVCIAGHSSGAGHSRVSGSGAVAMEQIGPATEHGRKARARLVGLVHYESGP